MPAAPWWATAPHGGLPGRRQRALHARRHGGQPGDRGHRHPHRASPVLGSAWKVKEESGGWFDECTDEEILAAQKLLAEKEGVFCEPASATSLAGALRDVRTGRSREGSSIVCTLTGHGLKDPDTAIAQSTRPLINVEAKLDQVKRAILDNM
jgi:threonine synthase